MLTSGETSPSRSSLESHWRNPEVVRRFVAEAQIGGQLQHPGVVPVYELGAFPDQRPYFAMKLVKGRTLAALLGERGCVSAPSPRESTPGADATGLAVGARLGSPGERGCVSAPSPPNPTPGAAPTPGADATPGAAPTPGADATPGAAPTPGADATGLAADLPRFLGIFEQVCQTMAYAHARGVIHRDLKPSRVMVGSFGEVQVMDWGLAKVLAQGGIADEAGSRPAHETVIMTVRTGLAGSGSESQAGSVLGTPAYMAPEQARGEVDRIDERADVLSLGAILCEILTGRRPFLGETREEIRAQSARGDLGDALGRLKACGAEAELIGLARDCLAPERGRRPRSAGQVSGRMTAFLTGLQERLRSAELARAAEQARAEEAQGHGGGGRGAGRAAVTAAHRGAGGSRSGRRRLSANEKELNAQSSRSLFLLSSSLVGQGDRALAERVLRRAWRIKPDDFWVNIELAGARYWIDSSLGRLEETVRYLSVAVALRPAAPLPKTTSAPPSTYKGGSTRRWPNIAKRSSWIRT